MMGYMMGYNPSCEFRQFYSETCLVHKTVCKRLDPYDLACGQEQERDMCDACYEQRRKEAEDEAN